MKPAPLPKAPTTESEPPKKVSSLFAGADDSDEDEVKPVPAKLPEPPKISETKPVPPPVFKPAPAVPSQEPEGDSKGVTDFKQSLNALLNMNKPGIGRKPTIQQKKPANEEEEQKEKIKFDVYLEEEAESPDYKAKTTLDNVTYL
jgi:hypothetical protein